MLREAASEEEIRIIYDHIINNHAIKETIPLIHKVLKGRNMLIPGYRSFGEYLDIDNGELFINVNEVIRVFVDPSKQGEDKVDIFIYHYIYYGDDLVYHNEIEDTMEVTEFRKHFPRLR